MQILWKYQRPHRTLIFFALLLAGAAQFLSLAVPLIFEKIIDEYATNTSNLIAR